MNSFSHVPPGFRFHPTEEELVDYYLRKKIASKRIDLDVVKDVDLYKIEPWDLQELCKTGSEEQTDWYFFSHKDKKYPTGTRTNRATKAGFWKATGRDKAIYSRHSLIGMRKTLVFYQGRAPNGQKSDWIMHEYRLETNENGTSQEEGWVVCRAFKKRLATVRKMGDYDSPCNNWYDEQVSFIPEINSPTGHQIPQPFPLYHHDLQYYPCKQELELQYNMSHQHDDAFLQLPQLESPKVPQSAPITTPQSAPITTLSCNSVVPYGSTPTQEDRVMDWRVLDKFVASQLSREDGSKEDDYSNAAAEFHVDDEQMNMQSNNNGSSREEIAQEYASTSTSSCQIDLWK